MNTFLSNRKEIVKKIDVGKGITKEDRKFLSPIWKISKVRSGGREIKIIEIIQ